MRIFDRVKARGEGTACRQTACARLMGVVAHSDATKGVVTTTSEFAPMIERTPTFKTPFPKDSNLSMATIFSRRPRGLKALLPDCGHGGRGGEGAIHSALSSMLAAAETIAPACEP